jgi:glycosyltransferase involved in cell wall biosynthesis
VRILAFKRTLPWPLSSGQHLLTYHVLSLLAKTHELLLACWEGERTSPARLPFQTALRTLPQAHAGPGKVDRYLIDHYGMNAATVPWLRSLIDEFRPDVLFGIDYQTLIALDGTPDIPSACYLIDNRWLQDVERLRREKTRQWANLKSVLWSYILHRRYARAADVYIFVTDRDAAALRRFTDRECVGVPGGVDTEHFHPSALDRSSASVAFVGSLNFPPNVAAVGWFCREVWPIVRRSEPAARLMLVGKQPVEEVLAWHGRDGIRVAADVPDVRPYLDWAAAAVVPMRSGGGIKNKILEAWAMAVPVVATSMSLHGLAARVDENILTADQPAEFARQVLRLLSDPELRTRFGQRGRETAVREHSWDHTAARMERCLLDARQRAACTCPA